MLGGKPLLKISSKLDLRCRITAKRTNWDRENTCPSSETPGIAQIGEFTASANEFRLKVRDQPVELVGFLKLCDVRPQYL